MSQALRCNICRWCREPLESHHQGLLVYCPALAYDKHGIHHGRITYEQMNNLELVEYYEQKQTSKV